MRLTPPAAPKPPVPGVPAAATPPAPPVPGMPPKPAGVTPPPVPGVAKPPADLRKETMRISLPPRPGGAGAAAPAKPAGGPSPAATQLAKPIAPVAGAGGVVQKPGVPTQPTPTVAPRAGGAAVARTVVDNDSGGTALAIAALVASLVAFGIVLMSYLGK